VEAARTMLIYSSAPLFLWADAVATACFTQNRSLVHLRFNKIPYELVNTEKPSEQDLENFFELMFDEYYGGTSTNASHQHSAAPAQNHLPPPPQDASTTIEAEAPTTSTSSTSTPATPVIETDLPTVDEQYLNTNFQEDPTNNSNDVALEEEELFENPFATNSAESSSRLHEPSNTHTLNPRYPSTFQWTKDHPIEHVIGEPSKPL
jgi:hypothetical protein